ncbi:MAG: acetaldehyde dehydrogenase (acetylating), partial [Myxococcota bacterium]|nr:acetaldehyde dehydrogenase (acetylating) [Myxococcota bacterium]
MSESRTVPVAILGPGNIGTDLLFKAQRSAWLNPVWSIGVVEASEGLSIARERGVNTTHKGLSAVIDQLVEDGVRIAFDATSARHHVAHSQALVDRGIRVVDLTPAAIGPYCVPSVNPTAHLQAPNLNMISCGAQATIPMVAAVSNVQAVAYAEIVATVASRSIGPGTRNNIDEFTRTTRAGVEQIGGAKVGKAIIVINPADPPIIMRDTIH